MVKYSGELRPEIISGFCGIQISSCDLYRCVDKVKDVNESNADDDDVDIFSFSFIG